MMSIGLRGLYLLIWCAAPNSQTEALSASDATADSDEMRLSGCDCQKEECLAAATVDLLVCAGGPEGGTLRSGKILMFCITRSNASQPSQQRRVSTHGQKSDLSQSQAVSAALIDPCGSRALHCALCSCFCPSHHAPLSANPSCRAIWASNFLFRDPLADALIRSTQPRLRVHRPVWRSRR